MLKEYKKDFDSWNTLKQQAERSNRKVFAHPREVWWCSLGVNIGVEADGKNDNFERPVLVINVYNRHSMLILPITGQSRQDTFHTPIRVKELNRETGEKFTKTVYVKLTQARVISNKRLLRKVDVLSKSEFKEVVTQLRNFI